MHIMKYGAIIHRLADCRREHHAVLILEQDFQAQVTLRLAIRPDKFTFFQQALTERFAGQLGLVKIE